MKNLGPKDPALGCPLRELQYVFPLAAVCWSDGALQNIKFQALSLGVSGVGCQVSGKKNKKTETSVFVMMLNNR
jgi:hypothetical protein